MSSDSDCTSKWVDNSSFTNDCEEFDKLKCKEFDYVAKQQQFGKKLTRVKGNRGCEIEQSKKIKVWTGKPKNENASVASDLEDEELPLENNIFDKSPEVSKKARPPNIPQKGNKRKAKNPVKRKPKSDPNKKIHVVPVITEPMTQSKHSKMYALQTPEQEDLLMTKSVLKPMVELDEPSNVQDIVINPSEESIVVLDRPTEENADDVVLEFPEDEQAIPIIEVEKTKTKKQAKPVKTVLVTNTEDPEQNAPLTAVVYDSDDNASLLPVVELPKVNKKHAPVIIEVEKPKTKSQTKPVKTVLVAKPKVSKKTAPLTAMVYDSNDESDDANLVPVVELSKINKKNIPVIEVEKPKTKTRATPVELVAQTNKKSKTTKKPTELIYMTPSDLEYGPQNLSFRKRLQPVKKDKKETKVYMGPENLSFRKRLKPVKKGTDADKMYFGPDNLSFRKRLQPVKTVLVTKPEVPEQNAPLTAVVLDSDDDANLMSLVELPKTEKTNKKNIPVIELIEKPKTTTRSTPLELVLQPEKPTEVISLQPSQEFVPITEIEKPKTKTPVTIALQSTTMSPQKTVKLVSLKSPPQTVQLRELGPENLSLRKRLKPVKEESDDDKLYFGPENLSFRKRLQPVKTLLATNAKVPKQKSPQIAVVLEPEIPKADYVTLQTVPVVKEDEVKSKAPITIALQPTESSEEMSPQKSVKLVSLKSSPPPPPPLPPVAIYAIPNKKSAEQPREQTLIIAPENLSLRKRLKAVEKAPTTNKIYFGPEDLVWRDRLKPAKNTVKYLPVVDDADSDEQDDDAIVLDPDSADLELEEPKPTAVYALTSSPQKEVYTVKPEKEKTYVMKTNEKPATYNKVYFGPEDKPWRDRLQPVTRTGNVVVETLPVVEVEEEPATEKKRRSSKITRMVDKVKKAVDTLREEEFGTKRPIQRGPHREARGVKPATHFGPEIKDVRVIRKI